LNLLATSTNPALVAGFFISATDSRVPLNKTKERELNLLATSTNPALVAGFFIYSIVLLER
ncbi:MAG TPA: hypothetical protein PKL45_00770, partial [Bacteroidia bacterium]|nr:hypothetical protein [Bacteroidia bacterium]